MNSKKIILIVMVLVLSFPLFSQAAKEVQEKVENRNSDDLAEIMLSIQYLEVEIEEIENEHDRLWNNKKKEIEQSFIPKTVELESLVPEIWETDNEFQLRKSQEEQKLLGEMEKEIEKAEAVALVERNNAKRVYEEWLSEAFANLSTPRLIEKDYLTLRPQEYQRNERRWPIRIDSNHPLIPFEDLEVVVDFEHIFSTSDSYRDIRQEIVDFNEAVETSELSTEVTWTAYQDKLENRFVLGVSEVEVTNGINGISYKFEYPDLLLMSAYRVAGTQVERVSVITDVEPLFPLEFSTEEPIILLPPDSAAEVLSTSFWQIPQSMMLDYYHIEPENSFNKAIILSTKATDIFHYDYYQYREQLRFAKAGDIVFTISADGNLFAKDIQVEVSGNGYVTNPIPKTITPAVSNEPNESSIKTNEPKSETKKFLSEQKNLSTSVTTTSYYNLGNRITGIGLGLSIGYPSVNFDVSYSLDYMKMAMSISFLWDSSFLIESGVKLEIIENLTNDIYFYWNLGLSLLFKQRLNSYEFGIGFHPIGFSYYLRNLPLEIFANMPLHFYFNWDSDTIIGFTLGAKYYL